MIHGDRSAAAEQEGGLNNASKRVLRAAMKNASKLGRGRSIAGKPKLAGSPAAGKLLMETFRDLDRVAGEARERKEARVKQRRDYEAGAAARSAASAEDDELIAADSITRVARKIEV